MMIKPDSGQSEWIELYNLSNSAINLDGYWLDDDDSLMVNGAIQKGTQDPGSDPKALSGEILSKQFKAFTFSSYLNDTGDIPTLFLVSENSESKLDSYAYTDNPDQNITYGRIPDGVGGWQKCSPTFESPNGQCQDISSQDQPDQVDSNEDEDVKVTVSKSPSPSLKATQASPKPSATMTSTTKKSQVLGKKESQPSSSEPKPDNHTLSPSPSSETNQQKNPPVKAAVIVTGSGVLLIGLAFLIYYLYTKS